MSGETERDESGWTTDTLKYHVNQQLRAVDDKIEALDRLTDSKFITLRTVVDGEAERVALALASQDKAVTKAEVANEKRFEAVNEFRAQLKDQAGLFITRAEFEALTQRIQDLTDRINRSEGKSLGSTATLAGVATIVTLLFTAIVIAVNIFISS